MLGIVYLFGLFVPLMDNDAAHHATIALQMHLSGDYVSLVDYGEAYLDKPHLHFWLCAFSYKIFGVTGFAYKFPSLLFTLLGTWSVYRLGRLLYNAETGKLAALLAASAFSYILANSDVRMDAILTACVAFASWQLVAFIHDKKMINLAGAALGLALGFSTKGHIAVFVPAAGAFFYILYRKEWKLFLNPKWLLLLLLFGLLISPVVYCYYLQYNLHPETTVRGKNQINGVKFILLDHSLERFRGERSFVRKNDRLFFIHSFLWAFAPWGVPGFIAVIRRLGSFFRRKEEWLTTGTFMVTLLVVSFSGFKLPHYVNIVFPSAAVMTAAFLLSKKQDPGWNKAIYLLQLIVCILMLLFIAGLSLWAFPVKKWWVIPLTILFLSVFFYFLRNRVLSRLQKAVCLSVSAISLCFLLLNSSFYPQLLRYQGGQGLAEKVKGKVNTDRVFTWNNHYSSSFNFYSGSIARDIAAAGVDKDQPAWLLFVSKDEDQIAKEGFVFGKRYEVPDYMITRLKWRFIRPATRDSACHQLILAEIISR